MPDPFDTSTKAVESCVAARSALVPRVAVEAFSEGTFAKSVAASPMIPAAEAAGTESCIGVAVGAAGPSVEAGPGMKDISKLVAATWMIPATGVAGVEK